MIQIPPSIMNMLMTQIVEATHCLANENGDPHVFSTISAANLRMAAITAIQVATGTEAWPGDRPLRLKRQSIKRYGIIELED